MKRKTLLKLFAAVFIIGAILQTCLIPHSTAEAQPIENTGDGIEISPEILDLIRQSDPANYEKNVANYRELLVSFDVQQRFKDEIERLITEGHNIANLMIAYEFLHDGFGRMEELEALSTEEQSGKAWEQIFTDYNQASGEFIPGSFEPEYLEQLMGEPFITADDIMMADIISAKSGETFENIIGDRIDRIAWKEINQSIGILSSRNQLPRVQVTAEQIAAHTADGRLTRQQVVEAFVTARKLGRDAEEIIGKVKAGFSKEEIYAECYRQKYY